MLKDPLHSVGLGRLLKFPLAGMSATLPRHHRPVPPLLMLEKQAFGWGSGFLFGLICFVSFKILGCSYMLCEVAVSILFLAILP